MNVARVACLGWVLATLVLSGCASLSGPTASGRATADKVPIRPDLPAEYDVLVAEQLTVEGRRSEALDAWLRAVAKDDSSAYLHRQAASALAQHSRLGESLEHAQRAVELEPDDVESRVFLGQLHRIRRDVPAAEKVLTDDDGQPLDVSAAYLLYQIYMDGQRHDEALKMAQWLVAHDKDGVRGQVALASVYQRTGRDAEAEAALRKAAEYDPGNLRIYWALAGLLRARGDIEGELALYHEILELYPYHHGTLVRMSEAQQQIKDYDGAIATLELIEERYPDDLQTALRLGYLLFDAHRHDEAEERLERVLATHPDDYEAAFFLGVVRRRSGDVPGALAAFESIPAEHRYYPEARAQIASVYERRGDFAQALAEVERGLAARGDRDLELYAATLLAKSGHLDEAVARVEQLLAENPDDDDLLFNMGVLYGEAGRTDASIEYMQKALDQNPDNASALNYIGYTWAERGINLDEAEKMIRRAIELRPDDGYIVDSLGWIYYMRALPLVEKGRSREAKPLLNTALEELHRAHEMTGGDPVISEHLGDTWLLLDDKEKALEQFEDAVRREPREDEQPKLREKLETLQRELR
jgi:tetratricopeptide (TPR) repeat protein